MIHSIQITNPKDWISNHKPTKTNEHSPEFGYMGSLSKPNNFHYALHLPSLTGKSFTFQPGLNIIVGTNGSGKTSLLNLLRRITFCEKSFYSNYDPYQLSSLLDDGIIQCCKVTADYRKSTFALRLSSDLYENEIVADALSLLQHYEDAHSSAGQSLYMAINQMAGLFIQNGKRDNSENIRDFHKQVIDSIAKRVKYEPTDRPSHNQYVLDYFKANQKDSQCYTFILDEPDKGLDINLLSEIYTYLKKSMTVDYSQQIVVLHNVALIQKLRGIPKVNWIELSDGYLKAIDKFSLE